MRCKRYRKKILRKRADAIICKDGGPFMYFGRNVSADSTRKYKKWKKQGFRLKLVHNNEVTFRSYHVDYWYRWDGV